MKIAAKYHIFYLVSAEYRQKTLQIKNTMKINLVLEKTLVYAKAYNSDFRYNDNHEYTYMIKPF